MKKILCLLTAVLMIFALSSCSTGTGKDMYQMYVKANEAMKDVDSLKMDMNMDITIEIGGETMDMTIGAKIDEVIRSETDIDLAMDMVMSMLETDISMKVFYKEGIYYYDMMGQKIKMPMSIDEISSQVNTEAISFPESAVKNMEIKDVDGGKELSFTLDGAALDDVLTQQLGSLNEAMGDGLSYTFYDVDLKAVIGKDDMFKSVSMKFSFDMNIEGETAKADCVMDMNFIQLGGVTINFPSDLDEYVEMDLG